MAVVLSRTWTRMTCIVVLVTVVEGVHPSSVGVQAETDGSKKVSTGGNKESAEHCCQGRIRINNSAG